MESVYSLVTLPRPLDKRNGRCHVAAVSAFSGGRKRKRFEVAAVVDGESLTVHNASQPLCHLLSRNFKLTIKNRFNHRQSFSRMPFLRKVDS
jgi:hypothetical protein